MNTVLLDIYNTRSVKHDGLSCNFFKKNGFDYHTFYGGQA
jgi:hypothetical protein